LHLALTLLTINWQEEKGKENRKTITRRLLSLPPPPWRAGNLDFDARVPIPFSIFPSTYRDAKEGDETTRTRVEAQVTQERVGREEERTTSSVEVGAKNNSDRLAGRESTRPSRRSSEEVRIYEERDREEKRTGRDGQFVRERYVLAQWFSSRIHRFHREAIKTIEKHQLGTKTLILHRLAAHCRSIDTQLILSPPADLDC